MNVSDAECQRCVLIIRARIDFDVNPRSSCSSPDPREGLHPRARTHPRAHARTRAHAQLHERTHARTPKPAPRHARWHAPAHAPAHDAHTLHPRTHESGNAKRRAGRARRIRAAGHGPRPHVPSKRARAPGRRSPVCSEKSPGSWYLRPPPRRPKRNASLSVAAGRKHLSILVS